jgi:hypothetical protein
MRFAHKFQLEDASIFSIELLTKDDFAIFSTHSVQSLESTTGETLNFPPVKGFIEARELGQMPVPRHLAIEALKAMIKCLEQEEYLINPNYEA